MADPPRHPAPGTAPARTPPTLRGLLGLAWPIVVSRSSQVVVGISDAVMVAHLGEAALAATTTGAMNAFVLFIFPMGVVFIVSSFSSQLLGRGDLAGARRYGWYGLAVAAATQLLGVAGIPAVGSVLGLLDHAPEVRRLMTDYLALRLWSGGAAIGLEALGNYYGGLGNTRLPMRASVAAMVLNVAGNWLLIDGHLGAPAMGVRGAALASALSTGAAFLGLLAVFLAEGRRAPGRGRLRARELGRMLRFGLPSGLNWFFEFFAFMFFVNVVVGGLGTTSLAALMAVIQVNSFSFMPAFGLASAGAILVGQAIGAGGRDEVPRLVWLTFAATGTWQVAVGLTYLLVPGVIFAPFARDPASAEGLLAAGTRMLALSAAWQLFDATVATLAESLRAAGDTAFTMWARVAVAWLVFVPGSWITVRRLGGGDLAAVGWIVGYLALLAGVLLCRFRAGAWRRLELIEPAP
ncbi:MAG TPA: MATE family efflux transporter [Anaeromyxobacteraceae bacterium]|nr:MATE family efflux transporter [Anaeromyxobacteraceae bacterium]